MFCSCYFNASRLYCTHANRALLKGSCLFGCDGKFNSLSFSQNSQSLLEQGGCTGVSDKVKEQEAAQEKKNIP